jgi:glutamine---fructose-6-phosphate transaminase (isomerizing)
VCGIAGCVGHDHAPSFVLGSLETLQYRGYDSAGLAYPVEAGNLVVAKMLGNPSNLRGQMDLDAADALSTGAAIGHNRWATQGEVNLANTHPHTDRADRVASVCNGNIENYVALKRELNQTLSRDEDDPELFSSTTDTEVIAHWFGHHVGEGMEPEEAFRKTLTQLKGAYAILLTWAEMPDTIFVGKISSPLVLGINGTEHIAASDASVLGTKKAIFLGDGEMATLTGGEQPHITKIKDSRRVHHQPEDIEGDHEQADKGPYPHFMLKEIYDSAETIQKAIAGRVHPESHKVKLGGLEAVEGQLRDINRIIIVACGTSYYAGLIGEKLIEEIAGIPVEVESASEFIYNEEPLDKNTAVIAVSQSGETADTSEALKKADEHGLLKIGVVNKTGSKISRDTDAGVFCRAGSEISVASTKAFISQVTILTEVAMYLAKSNRLSQPLMEELTELPAKIEALLADTSAIQAAAKKYAGFSNFLFIGRGYNYPVAMEGALKLKEVSYIHAEGYGAGEMKHGPLAMIDENFPTVALATDSPQLDKTMLSIGEIRARKGPVLAIATEGNSTIESATDDVIFVPKSLEQTQPILNAIALQLFAYHVAVEKGLSVDQPRNLAKSVTVE